MEERQKGKTELTAKKAKTAGNSKKSRARRKKRIKSYILRSLLCLLTAVILVLLGTLGALYVVFRGPSETACGLMVNTLLETSALKFVPRIYFSEEEVQQIVARNTVIEPEEETDTSLVVIKQPEQKDEGQEEKDIEIIEITGATYRGWLMIVQDPSRVVVGVSRKSGFEADEEGKQLHEIVEEYGAVAGINGGAFEDGGGMGNGGMPIGVVISEGNLMRRATNGSRNTVIGFDENDKLLVGKFTASKAQELGMRDCVSFGPALVVNGEPAVIEGASSGLNPRTAIGQRADGAVLMLVIDGRQVNSLGASMSDLIEIMMRYGAVNAGNLDGGSSSNLYYEGEYLNDGVSLTGARDIPTTFVVR